MSALSWFGVQSAHHPLEQGTILFDFEYLDVESINTDVLKGAGEAKKVKSDIIILTQSCDLANEKTQHIHICPVFTLKEAYIQLGHDSNTKKKNFFDELKSQRRVDKYLTDRCDKHIARDKYFNDYLVVALDMAVVVSNTYIRQFAANQSRRLVLTSPYRESLAQAYGRYFMRIGNPVNIQTLDLSFYA